MLAMHFLPEKKDLGVHKQLLCSTMIENFNEFMFDQLSMHCRWQCAKNDMFCFSVAASQHCQKFK